MRPRVKSKARMLSAIGCTLAMGVLAATAMAVQEIGADDQLKLWKRNYDSLPIRSLLEMVLDKTPGYGEVELAPSPVISQGRALRYLQEGEHGFVRVANVAASPRRNQTLQPIRIPIDQGLLGFRVCLIRDGEQQRFTGIHSASDFREKGLQIGQGAHWPDTRILRASDFEVVTAPAYENLLRMLMRKRFDCFLRGVGEVFVELEQHQPENLVVEDRLLFTYRMPSYFFVSPGDERLAERIRTGLARAMRDGDYDRWFKTHFGEPMKRLELIHRVFIPLPNPFLTDGDVPARIPMAPRHPEDFLPIPVRPR